MYFGNFIKPPGSGIQPPQPVMRPPMPMPQQAPWGFDERGEPYPGPPPQGPPPPASYPMPGAAPAGGSPFAMAPPGPMPTNTMPQLDSLSPFQSVIPGDYDERTAAMAMDARRQANAQSMMGVGGALLGGAGSANPMSGFSQAAGILAQAPSGRSAANDIEHARLMDRAELERSEMARRLNYDQAQIARQTPVDEPEQWEMANWQRDNHVQGLLESGQIDEQTASLYRRMPINEWVAQMRRDDSSLQSPGENISISNGYLHQPITDENGRRGIKLTPIMSPDWQQRLLVDTLNALLRGTSPEGAPQITAGEGGEEAIAAQLSALIQSGRTPYTLDDLPDILSHARSIVQSKMVNNGLIAWEDGTQTYEENYQPHGPGSGYPGSLGGGSDWSPGGPGGGYTGGSGGGGAGAGGPGGGAIKDPPPAGTDPDPAKNPRVQEAIQGAFETPPNWKNPVDATRQLQDDLGFTPEEARVIIGRVGPEVLGWQMDSSVGGNVVTNTLRGVRDDAVGAVNDFGEWGRAAVPQFGADPSEFDDEASIRAWKGAGLSIPGHAADIGGGLLSVLPGTTESSIGPLRAAAHLGDKLLEGEQAIAEGAAAIGPEAEAGYRTGKRVLTGAEAASLIRPGAAATKSLKKFVRAPRGPKGGSAAVMKGGITVHKPGGKIPKKVTSGVRDAFSEGAAEGVGAKVPKFHAVDKAGKVKAPKEDLTPFDAGRAPIKAAVEHTGPPPAPSPVGTGKPIEKAVKSSKPATTVKTTSHSDTADKAIAQLKKKSNPKLFAQVEKYVEAKVAKHGEKSLSPAQRKWRNEFNAEKAELNADAAKGSSPRKRPKKRTQQQQELELNEKPGKPEKPAPQQGKLDLQEKGKKPVYDSESARLEKQKRDLRAAEKAAKNQESRVRSSQDKTRRLQERDERVAGKSVDEVPKTQAGKKAPKPAGGESPEKAKAQLAAKVKREKEFDSIVNEAMKGVESGQGTYSASVTKGIWERARKAAARTSNPEENFRVAQKAIRTRLKKDNPRLDGSGGAKVKTGGGSNKNLRSTQSKNRKAFFDDWVKKNGKVTTPEKGQKLADDIRKNTASKDLNEIYGSQQDMFLDVKKYKIAEEGWRAGAPKEVKAARPPKAPVARAIRATGDPAKEVGTVAWHQANGWKGKIHPRVSLKRYPKGRNAEAARKSLELEEAAKRTKSTPSQEKVKTVPKVEATPPKVEAKPVKLSGEKAWEEANSTLAELSKKSRLTKKEIETQAELTGRVANWVMTKARKKGVKSLTPAQKRWYDGAPDDVNTLSHPGKKNKGGRRAPQAEPKNRRAADVPGAKPRSKNSDKIHQTMREMDNLDPNSSEHYALWKKLHAWWEKHDTKTWLSEKVNRYLERSTPF